VLVTFPDTQVVLNRLPRTVTNFDNTRRFLVQQFQIYDKDQKGVTQKDVQQPQLRFLQPLFALADRDGDGRLTEAELTAYLDLQQQAAGSCHALRIGDHGRSLFDLLDANRDGRLGPRELRSAWTRLSAYDRNGDGCISRDELPRQFHVTLN